MALDIDTITRTVTASRTYAELVECCKGGYIPTLLPNDGRKGGAERDALTERLRKDGFKVWRGSLSERPE
jgi:hypothetical protein